MHSNQEPCKALFRSIIAAWTLGPKSAVLFAYDRKTDKKNSPKAGKAILSRSQLDFGVCVIMVPVPAPIERAAGRCPVSSRLSVLARGFRLPSVTLAFKLLFMVFVPERNRFFK